MALSAALSAQWLNQPTPGVPRTADGKPDMSAPAPRTADGKPDLTGMWGWDTPAKCGAKCNDTQISREFLNIAATLKGGVPYQPGVEDLVKHIAHDLRNHYTISYTPTNKNLDGTWRDVKVNITALKNMPKFTWHTKPGYTAPKPDRTSNNN